jgi:hypothetical protein
MPQAFGEKLSFVLKFLSLSRGQLAAELCVDKSIVGRWATGRVVPSAHNLARLTTLVARRVEGFNAHDWDRELSGLAERLGMTSPARPGPAGGPPPGLPLVLLDQIVAATAMRVGAYEGFFRSTRPSGSTPGAFLHDHGLIRRDASGLMSLRMRSGGVAVEGWMLPLHGQLFCIAAELTSGSLVFGIFNGVPGVRAQVIEGLVLNAIMDVGRTPTASAIAFERIGDLSGDEEADNRRLDELDAGVQVPGGVDESLAAFLVRDFGPAQLAAGGDWLLNAPKSRSISRGPIAS